MATNLVSFSQHSKNVIITGPVTITLEYGEPDYIPVSYPEIATPDAITSTPDAIGGE